MIMKMGTWKTWWRRAVYLLQSSLRCRSHLRFPSLPGRGGDDDDGGGDGSAHDGGD